ncbi:MAG: aldehyde dehydrogenase family protein, partial [Candidatus Kerfeldbacteria bacterium]|nr:aldehyde dehydrogenase family protein [Candidatus Kerfeldbacteria bacterium]
MDGQLITRFLEKLDYGPAPESNTPATRWLEQHERRFGHFVGGEYLPPSSGQYFETMNPATGATLAEVAMGDADDVNAAMAAAQAAFPAWSALSGLDRARYLYAIARAIAKHERLFSVLEAMDNGKTFRETKGIDIPLVIRHFYYHAGWAQRLQREFPGRRPGGVIGQIIPWNFPLLMLAWKIAPALAAGNTVVLKPAESTPLTALALSEILRDEVGLPKGVVNIVTGGPETGELIVRHQTPWKIAFTGSTEVGRRIREITAGSGKKLTMELGGKSPFIVFKDADLDAAVEGVVDAIWFNQGEVCCAGSRLLVEESIEGPFIAKLKLRMERLRGGDPLDKTMDMGAVNSAAQFEKITGLIAEGQRAGCMMWQPENWSCPTDGYFVPPTLFMEVNTAHQIAQVEIFGPVLVVMSFRTPDEAVALANNTAYGLAASIWTQDIDKALHAARRIKAGTVWINSTNVFDAAAPFGGYKQSGYGREGGRDGMEDVLVEARDESAAMPNEEVAASATRAPERRDDNGTAAGSGIDRTFRFFIGGKLQRPDAGGSFGIRGRAGQLLGVMSDATRKDVRNAVEAARGAAVGWGENTAAHTRSQILYFLAENLDAQKERFVTRIEEEMVGSRSEAEVEFEQALERLFYWAGSVDKFEGRVQPVPGRFLVTATPEPMGVIGVRTPNQYPLLALVGAIGPAMATGNTVAVVAGAPCVAMDFVQVIQNSDVPAGVVNILTAQDPDGIAKLLAEHMDVDHVWHFGTEKGGTAVEKASAGNMKRTWVPHGRLDWTGPWGASDAFLREATQ